MSNYSNSRFQGDPNTSWYKVSNFITDAATVLDVGCSSGNFGKELIDHKKCVVDGVEIDESDRAEAEQKLRKVYNFNIEEGAPANLEGLYDFIYYGDVIEHLMHPKQALERTKALLKEGGAVMFSIPNMTHMSVRLMLLKGGFEYGETGLLDKTHLHFYSLMEIKRLFFEAGYDIIELDYVKRDIPREVLTSELLELGLTPSDKYLDSTKTIEASAYQFVGVAKPSKHPHAPSIRQAISPSIDEMEKHIAYIKGVHEAQIRAHKFEIARLETENALVNKRLATAQTRKAFFRRLFR